MVDHMYLDVVVVCVLSLKCAPTLTMNMKNKHTKRKKVRLLNFRKYSHNSLSTTLHKSYR